MYKKIKEAGKAVSDKYSGTMDYFNLTPASLSLLKSLLPSFRNYAKGNLLDAGAGRLSYRFIIEEYCDSYWSIDIDTRSGEVDGLGDIQKLPLKDEMFDSVFCTQVLEHVPEPQEAMNELFRVLRPGGYAIITVPHLGYLHNEPHDYYRYTKHGLRYMLEKGGFEVEKIVPAGGLISFLGHIVSTLIINLTAWLPFFGMVTFFINKLFVKAIVTLDQAVEKKKLFALNYVAIAKKKSPGKCQIACS